MHRIIILGIQRSGTNYLEYLTKRVYRDVGIMYFDHADYIWKHTAVEQTLDPKIIHIAITKNPYMWVQSLNRYSADIYRNYGDRSTPMPKSKTKLYDKLRGTVYLESSLELYKKLYSRWQKRSEVYVVQYEKILDKHFRQRTMQLIANHFGLEVISNPLNINPTRVGQTDDWSPNREQSYLNPNPKKYIKEVNEILGQQFIESLGYKFINI